MADAFRTERDSLGEAKIPANAYWSTTIQRAVESHPISGQLHRTKFNDAYVVPKLAASQANKDGEALKPNIAGAIIQARKESPDGPLRDKFVVDDFQMGPSCPAAGCTPKALATHDWGFEPPIESNSTRSRSSRVTKLPIVDVA